MRTDRGRLGRHLRDWQGLGRRALAARCHRRRSQEPASLKATCVIAFRATSAARVRNLHAVVGALDRLDGLLTVVVEQDERPRVEARRLPSSCRLLFERTTGPFNKSRGFNAGFRSSATDVLVFADADLLVPSRHMEAAVTACAGGIEVVRPWGDVVDLTEEETEAVVARDTDPAAFGHPSRRGRLRVGESPPLCGGAYVIRREVYERLGGQDERFRGWGGEDDAMSIKVQKLCSRVGVIRGGLAFHLCHPRHSTLPLDDPDYRANVALLGEYSKATVDELDGMCRTHRHALTCR